MIKSASQLKGKIKNLSGKDAKKAESYVRLFFMERFLERVSVSDYRHNFILKGGLLTSSLLGIDLRTTMDIDTTVTAIDLNENEIRRIVESICTVEMDDNISFEIIHMETIMDDFEYPGVRVHLEGHFEGIRQPIKIDVSTDDVITPAAIEYDYRLMFEDRTIKLMSYNTETLLAEKIQTILARGIANTRLRDYYDVYMIAGKEEYDMEILRQAFSATCSKRNTVYDADQAAEILNLIENDDVLRNNWTKYGTKYEYARGIEWDDVIPGVKSTIQTIVTG